MADALLAVAIEVAKCLVAPLGPRCGYVISYDSYISKLEHEAKKLAIHRENMKDSIDEAENNGKTIKDDVKNWAKDAETDTDEARRILNDNEATKKTCFYGWLPNPKARYRLGREAKRIAECIQKLIERIPPGKVYSDVPPGLVDGAPGVISSARDTIVDSRASILRNIMSALDDEKNKVIGIYGPGGVGKTTLLETVEKKLRNEKRTFHMIAKAKVSQAPHLKKIQRDIAHAFSLNLEDEPHEADRRDLLLKRLQKNPNEKVLVILDDLWKELDLGAVGIPSEDESSGCQVLLTSRDEYLLQKTGASLRFRLDGLSTEEAFRLFVKTYGPDKLKDEGYEAKAAQVVAKLAGLPLLIKSVASTLKYGDESAWNNALIKTEDSTIEAIVKWSYGHLEREETKSFFLLCGFIWGSIPVELLLVLGMGLGLFEGFHGTIQTSRNKLNDILHRLRSISLLQDDGDGGENVTIHDLYSEEVILNPLISQNSLMIHRNAGSWPKDKLEKCWVYLVNVGSDRLAELRLHWFPDLKIFMLSEQHDHRECFGLDFTFMKELRILYIRSVSFTDLCSFRPCKILENLQSLYLESLYLEDCYVKDVTILGELKSLQILSLAGSSFSDLPKEIGELTKLKLLNLNNCYDLSKIESGVIGNLINLEELYMRGMSKELMSEDEIYVGMGEDGIYGDWCNASLVELKSLKKLTTLEISISDPDVLLKNGDLPFGNLIKFWINIGNVDVDAREFEGLTTMMLNLKGCDGVFSIEWVQKTLQKTQYLHLDGLGEFNEKSAHELCSRGFAKLKHLDIQNCSSIKHVVSSSNGAFSILESLFLYNLTNLEKICCGPECFSKLKVINVGNCKRLDYLWSLSQMHRLATLEEIEVSCCDSMRAIAIDDAGKDIVVADNRVKLPNLRRLELFELPNMTSFCIQAGITSNGAPIQVGFPRLESLEMFGLLDLGKILYGQPPLECNSLKTIEIRQSRSTSSIILNSDWILKLPNLESLQINDSPSEEAVFDLDLEELKVTGHFEILSRLTDLKLFDLPNLRGMWKENAQLQGISVFRNLKELVVSNTGLAFLFPVSVAKCLREIRDIEVQYCENMEAVFVDEDGREEGPNDIIEFPLLKRLDIIGCPKLKFFSYLRGKKEAMAATSDSQDAYSDSFFDQKVRLSSLEQLHLDGARSVKRIWPRELPKNSFDNLARLNVWNCYELLNVFPSTITGRLHNLRSVWIIDCPSLESMFECGSLDSETTEQTGLLLPKLGGAPAREARRLSHVVKSDSQTVLGLPNLEDVEIKRCSKLRYLFPYVMATTLEKLESPVISYCEQMKEVVTKEEGDRAKADVMSFPSLKKLYIRFCPNFEAFIQNSTIVKRQLGAMDEENDESSQPLFNEMVTLPNLRRLEIDGVQCKELWNSEIPVDSFCKLEFLKLENCDNLQRIAPSLIWKKLQLRLEYLYVRSCRSIEIIYESDGTGTKFVKLRTLNLSHLENLRHIWLCGGLSNIPFPNLRYIKVLSCPSLEILFPTFTAEFLGQIEVLVVEDCKNMELIADHGECEEAFGTTITFSKLIGLKLEELPKFRTFLPEKYSLEFSSEAKLYVHSCGTVPNRGSVWLDTVYFEIRYVYSSGFVPYATNHEEPSLDHTSDQ